MKEWGSFYNVSQCRCWVLVIWTFYSERSITSEDSHGCLNCRCFVGWKPLIVLKCDEIHHLTWHTFVILCNCRRWKLRARLVKMQGVINLYTSHQYIFPFDRISCSNLSKRNISIPLLFFFVPQKTCWNSTFLHKDPTTIRNLRNGDWLTSITVVNPPFSSKSTCSALT